MPCRHLHVLYSARWRPAEHRPHCHQPHGGQNTQWVLPFHGPTTPYIWARESSFQKQETRAVTVKAEGHKRSQCQFGEVSALLHGCSSAPSQQHCTKLSWPTFKQIQILVFWKKYYFHGSLCRNQNVRPLGLPIHKRSGYKWMLMVRSHTSTQAPSFEEVILCFDILANVLPLQCRKDTCWGTAIEHMVLKSQADKSLTASDSGKRSIIAP